MATYTEQELAQISNIQSFKGQYPKQLIYLFLVEMWERFTFYGMRALLALYISHLILSADYHKLEGPALESKKIEFLKENGTELTETEPRYIIETSQQKFKDKAEATSNKQYGLINAFIYAMAFIGGLFADKLFGFRKSIFWGGGLMAIGTFIMAIPGSFAFYLGVSFLIVGNGFFKPNISTMVGALYKDGDSRRDSGFSLFYSGINIGAFLSGITIAVIGTSYSWSLGFAIAGICMLIGLGLFVFTQKSLGPIGKVSDDNILKPGFLGIKREYLLYAASLAFIPVFFAVIYNPYTFHFGTYEIDFSDLFMGVAGISVLGYLIFTIINLAKEERGKMIVAVILILFSVLFWSFFEQGGGSLNYFALGNVASHGLNMTSVNNSANALWVIILSPLVGILWTFMGKKNREPNTIVKFGLGFLFLGLGFLFFWYSKYSANEFARTPLAMFIGAYGIVSIGELCLSPIGLSMITRLSPTRLYGMMMGTWFLASAYGQYGAGLIGKALSGSNANVGQELSNLDKLNLYTGGYQTIGIISLLAGIVLILISPLLKKII